MWWPHARQPQSPDRTEAKACRTACVPGVSVSTLALEHGLNVNMVFRWRRMLRAGQFGDPHVGDAPVLFPVVVRGSGVEASSEASPTGVIRLQLAKGAR